MTDIEKRNLPITAEEIEIYQKLSQFCPLKIDLAELKSSIDTMSSNVTVISQKIANFEKVFIDYKVMETEFNHFKDVVSDLRNQLQAEKDDSVTKKDMMIYLTIGSLVIIILSAIIGIALDKLMT